MEEVVDKEIAFIEEIYTDEYRTLEQSIMYNVTLDKLSDGLESSFKRSTINPNLTILVETIYLNSCFEVIKREKGEEQ